MKISVIVGKKECVILIIHSVTSNIVLHINMCISGYFMGGGPKTEDYRDYRLMRLKC